MFICHVCKKQFKNQRALCGHKAICGRKKEKCPICEKEVLYLNYDRHLKSHKNDSKCPFCGKTVPGRNKYCSHSCAAAFNNKGIRRHGLPPTTCKNCGIKNRDSQRIYCSVHCQKQYEWKERKKHILETGSVNDFDARIAKRYLKEKDGIKCGICKRTSWMGKEIPLILDHVDGNSENNKLDNLRLVCGNCDMLLPTYKNKNKGNGRHLRRKRYAEGKSY